MQDTEILEPPQAPARPAANGEFNPLVSLFSDAFENLPVDIPVAKFIEDIKSNKHKPLIENIRSRFATAIGRGVEYKMAKRVIDSQKKRLAAVSFAGVLPMRDKKATPKFNGLLCADLDLLGDRMAEIRIILANDPHVFALFTSPTGEGLKVVYRIPLCLDAREYEAAFDAVSSRVQDLAGVAIDELADFTRLCFVSYDPQAFYNQKAIELPVNFLAPSKEPPKQPAHEVKISLPFRESRQRISERELGHIEWQTDILGDCKCPGEAQHTTGEKAHECQVHLDRVPTVHCVHKSCENAVAETNHRLRSAIGKAERPPLLLSSHHQEIADEYFDQQPEPDAKSKPSSLPEIVDSVAFMAAPHPAPPELIAGVLHQGSKLSLSGNSKAFKTWIYADLAVSVSHGALWLGFPTVPGKVLYINFEIQPFAWHARIDKLCRAKGIELKPDMLHFWNLRGKAAGFRQLIPLIIQRTKREGYALIIIDPIYKLLGGAEENSATDIAELLNSFERLAVETAASVAYAHHFAKGNAASKEAIDRQGGSGVFGRDPDSLLVFTAHEEPGAFTVEPILRNFPPVEPFVVRWKFPLMECDEALDPAKLKQVAGKKKEHDPVQLLAAIANNDEQNPISLPQWAERTGIARTTLNDYVTEMRRKGWVKTIGEGSRAKQAITNTGKAILNEH